MKLAGTTGGEMGGRQQGVGTAAQAGQVECMQWVPIGTASSRIQRKHDANAIAGGGTRIGVVVYRNRRGR